VVAGVVAAGGLAASLLLIVAPAQLCWTTTWSAGGARHTVTAILPAGAVPTLAGGPALVGKGCSSDAIAPARSVTAAVLGLAVALALGLTGRATAPPAGAAPVSGR
jgi:hypothetical protein